MQGPKTAAIPLVLDSPHSGRKFPGDFGAAVSETELRGGEDCYVDELYAAAPAMGAPLLCALWPRTYLDPNRNAGDVDLDLIDGPWPGEYLPSGKARGDFVLGDRDGTTCEPAFTERVRAALAAMGYDVKIGRAHV